MQRVASVCGEGAPSLVVLGGREVVGRDLTGKSGSSKEACGRARARRRGEAETRHAQL